MVAGLTKSGVLNSRAQRILQLMGALSECVCVGVCAEAQSVWGIYIDLERCLGQYNPGASPARYGIVACGFLPSSKGENNDFHTIYYTSARFNWGCETKTDTLNLCHIHEQFLSLFLVRPESLFCPWLLRYSLSAFFGFLPRCPP